MTLGGVSGLVAVRYAVTHTGAVITNDALPIATDRPMGGRFHGDIPRVTF